MRLCYLVLSHRGGDQLGRLIRTLKANDPTSAVVVRHDHSKSPVALGSLADSPGVHVLAPRAPVTWGTFSLVDATLDGLQHCRQEVEYDWLVLLSGQHYPVRPLDEFKALLVESDVAGYLEVPPPYPTGEAQTVDRWDRWEKGYSYQYVELPRLLCRVGARLPKRAWSDAAEWQRWVSVRQRPRGLAPLIGLRSRRPPFSGRAVKGGQWFTLSSPVVDWTLDWLTENPGYTRYFSRTYVPDESFFHTLLYTMSPWELSSAPLHYERWDDLEAASPIVLHTADVPTAVSSGMFFARKFDATTDEAALDLVDDLAGLQH